MRVAGRCHAAGTAAARLPQAGADGRYRLLAVQVIGHLVGSAHVTVEVQILAGVPDAEMVTQVVHEHFLCSCLIHLPLFSEECKQTDKTG